MKSVVCFVLLFGLVFGQKNYGNSTDDDFQNGYVDNPDTYERIVRPCQVYDLNCIRRFFAEHSNCQIRNGPVPGRFIRSQFSDYVPRVNVSLTATESIVTGLNNSRIEEFYYNEATDKVVIAIQARNLMSFSDITYIRFFRNGREPITVVTTTLVRYRSLTITAVIPNIKNIQLDQAEMTAFVPERFPAFFIGPQALLQSSDPQVAETVIDILTEIPPEAQELVLAESSFYAIYYIQSNICDFGLLFS